jgi:hypothetical protein
MIAGMSRDAFIADAWQVVGRKVSKELLLSDKYATAVSSIGLPVVLKRTNSFCDKFERYISKDRHNAHLRRKAYTASRPRWRAPYTLLSNTVNPLL